MQAARQQALGYVRALPPDEPRPLFVLVVDVGYCIDVYSNFAGVGDSFVPFPDQARFRLPLSALADEGTQKLLRQVWEVLRELDPSRRAARVTRELAGYLAGVSAQLERSGHPWLPKLRVASSSLVSNSFINRHLSSLLGSCFGFGACFGAYKYSRTSDSDDSESKGALSTIGIEESLTKSKLGPILKNIWHSKGVIGLFSR